MTNDIGEFQSYRNKWLVLVFINGCLQFAIGWAIGHFCK